MIYNVGCRIFDLQLMILYLLLFALWVDNHYMKKGWRYAIPSLVFSALQTLHDYALIAVAAMKTERTSE